MKIINLIKLCILLSCLVLIQSCAGIIWWKSTYTGEQVHGDNQVCGICHIPHKVKEKGLLKKTISELCFECHKDREVPTDHVVDVIPSMEVGELVLTDGKMTCVTCHDSHKNTYPNMLRTTPETLCQKCHDY